MTEKEIQEVLDELNTVRPEMLNENAKRLFEAIMKIADERDDLQQRVNKAIEYMKYNATSNYFDKEKNMFRREFDLLDILKGNDK